MDLLGGAPPPLPGNPPLPPTSAQVRAFDGAEQVGSLDVHDDYDPDNPTTYRRWKVWGVFVKDSHRGRGIAEAMAQALQEATPDQWLYHGGFSSVEGEGFAQRMIDKHPAWNRMAFMNSPPPRPGTQPIPSGHVRCYTKIGAMGQGAAPEVIAREGLRLDKARTYTDTFGEFKAVWAVRGTPDIERIMYSACMVEFSIPREEAEAAGAYSEGSHVAISRDVPPSEFVQVYEPWHGIYYHLVDHSLRWDRAYMEDPANAWEWSTNPASNEWSDEDWHRAVDAYKRSLGITTTGVSSRTAMADQVPWTIISIRDTREFIEVGDEWKPVVGTGDMRPCDRCSKVHEIHAHVRAQTGEEYVVGVGCARVGHPELDAPLKAGQSAATTYQKNKAKYVAAVERHEQAKAAWAQIEALPVPDYEVGPGYGTAEAWTTIDGLAQVMVHHDRSGTDLTERLRSLEDAWRRSVYLQRFPEFKGRRPYDLAQKVDAAKQLLDRSEARMRALNLQVEGSKTAAFHSDSLASYRRGLEEALAEHREHLDDLREQQSYASAKQEEIIERGKHLEKGSPEHVALVAEFRALPAVALSDVRRVQDKVTSLEALLALDDDALRVRAEQAGIRFDERKVTGPDACGRCGGTGHYGTDVLGGVCFDCGGSGRNTRLGMAGVDPNAHVMFEDRLGRCYELAGQYVMSNPGSVLIHGSIQGYGNPRIGHAWVIDADGEVFDGTMGTHFEDEMEYEEYANAEGVVSYTHDRMRVEMVRTGHWGPWHDSPWGLADHHDQEFADSAMRGEYA